MLRGLELVHKSRLELSLDFMMHIFFKKSTGDDSLYLNNFVLKLATWEWRAPNASYMVRS